MGISSNMNGTERLEFELAYFDVVVEHVNHYGTGNFPTQLYSFKYSYLMLYFLL